jgi:hypothetical protein
MSIDRAVRVAAFAPILLAAFMLPLFTGLAAVAVPLALVDWACGIDDSDRAAVVTAAKERKDKIDLQMKALREASPRREVYEQMAELVEDQKRAERNLVDAVKRAREPRRPSPRWWAQTKKGLLVAGAVAPFVFIAAEMVRDAVRKRRAS